MHVSVWAWALFGFVVLALYGPTPALTYLWGVLGALVMRGLMIAGGVYLLERFQWVIYPFAALIILAAVRLLWGREKEREIPNSPNRGNLRREEVA
jgi:tellurite resistance protein TerC